MIKEEEMMMLDNDHERRGSFKNSRKIKTISRFIDICTCLIMSFDA